MWLSNISDATISRNAIGYSFPYDSDFESDDEDQ